jgi:hypothetical protein
MEKNQVFSNPAKGYIHISWNQSSHGDGNKIGRPI